MENQAIPKTSPKDFFLHLLSMVTVYASAISFTVVVYQVINIAIPDVLDSGGYYVGLLDNARRLLRGGLSFLLVMFPAYLLTLKLLANSYKKDPIKIQLRVRKWLIYFTLFVAALINLFTLVFLLRRFLDGELTLRFALKFLSIFFVAGSTFLYYWWDLKQYKDVKRKIVVAVILGIIGIFVAVSFFFVGSPQSERLRRFDDIRVSHLSSLQYELLSYWQTKEQLPDSMDQLTDDIRGYQPPVDPVTNAPYEYQKTGDLSFNLCGTFAVSSKDAVKGPKVPQPFDGPYGEIGQESWDHDAGRVCFSRTIDADRYKPSVPTKK